MRHWHLLLVLSLIATAPVTWAQHGGHSGAPLIEQPIRTSDGPSLDDAIKELSSRDPFARLQAVKVLGAAKDDKAVEYLIRAVGDADLRVQAKAILLLGDKRATDATPVLVQSLLLRQTSPDMRRLILASLGKIGDTRAVRPLLEFLKRDLDTATRGTAIFALGEIGAPESVETLERIAQGDDDQTVRRLAGEAKRKIEGPRPRQQNDPSATRLAPDSAPQPQHRH